jgi:hypothetical protein
VATLKIHSGLFGHVVRLENPVKTADIAGGHQEDYGPPFEVITRAFFMEKSGFRDLVANSYDQLVWEYEAYTWWRSEFENNINKDTRLTSEDGRVFKIVSYKRMDEDRRYYKFLLITSQ